MSANLKPWAGKRISITFDNGPDPDCTPHVLDVLEARGITTPFFVCAQGNRLHPAMAAVSESCRPLLDDIIGRGHQIGNHTLTHTVELGTTIDPAVLGHEIDRNQELLGDYAPQRLFRPYMAGGQLGLNTFTQAAVDHLCAGDYTVVLFNSCPGDWHRPNDWPEFAFADVDAHDWTVLIAHDVARYRGMTQLERFLDTAIGRGAEFVPDFPDECVPIRGGRVTGNLDGLVSSTAQEPRPLSTHAVAHINTLEA